MTEDKEIEGEGEEDDDTVKERLQRVLRDRIIRDNDELARKIDEIKKIEVTLEDAV